MKKFFFLIMAITVIACDQANQDTSSGKANKQAVKISVAKQAAQLRADGFKIYDYIDEKSGDTIIMQQYFIAFLQRGSNKDHTAVEADSLQNLNTAHLGRMYDEGFIDISGPFGDDGELRGISIYNVQTLKMADSLSKLNPIVQSGKFKVEVKPWWAVKGYKLR